MTSTICCWKESRQDADVHPYIIAGTKWGRVVRAKHEVSPSDRIIESHKKNADRYLMMLIGGDLHNLKASPRARG